LPAVQPIAREQRLRFSLSVNFKPFAVSRQSGCIGFRHFLGASTQCVAIEIGRNRVSREVKVMGADAYHVFIKIAICDFPVLHSIADNMFPAMTYDEFLPESIIHLIDRRLYTCNGSVLIIII
jgi:hypothetical protein